MKVRTRGRKKEVVFSQLEIDLASTYNVTPKDIRAFCTKQGLNLASDEQMLTPIKLKNPAFSAVILKDFEGVTDLKRGNFEVPMTDLEFLKATFGYALLEANAKSKMEGILDAVIAEYYETVI